MLQGVGGEQQLVAGRKQPQRVFAGLVEAALKGVAGHGRGVVFDAVVDMPVQADFLKHSPWLVEKAIMPVL